MRPLCPIARSIIVKHGQRRSGPLIAIFTVFSFALPVAGRAAAINSSMFSGTESFLSDDNRMEIEFTAYSDSPNLIDKFLTLGFPDPYEIDLHTIDELTDDDLTDTDIVPVPAGGVCLVLGDMHIDCRLELNTDYAAFILGLRDPEAYLERYRRPPVERGDINGDSYLTFDDIDPFFRLIIPEPSSVILVLGAICTCVFGRRRARTERNDCN